MIKHEHIVTFQIHIYFEILFALLFHSILPGVILNLQTKLMANKQWLAAKIKTKKRFTFLLGNNKMCGNLSIKVKICILT